MPIRTEMACLAMRVRVSHRAAAAAEAAESRIAHTGLADAYAARLRALAQRLAFPRR